MKTAWMGKRTKKTVSLLTMGFFLVSQFAFANPGAGIEIAVRREMPSFLRIDIPSELATLDGLYEAPLQQDPKLILHIQNAHANYGAQQKIKELLQYLEKQYAMKTVFVEGASEDLNPDYLKMFPDRERNMKLAEFLAKQGELTGAELYLLEADHGPQTADHNQRTDSKLQATVSSLKSGPVRAVGIENAELYRENYDALKKVFGSEATVKRYLEGFEGRLSTLASKVFSKDLLKLLGEWKKFEKGHREFMPYVKSLASESKRVLGVDLESLLSQVEWPQITRLLVLQTMEKELDMQKGLAERDQLIRFLKEKRVSANLILAIENFRDQQVTILQGTQGGTAAPVEPRDLMEQLVTEAGPKGFYFYNYPHFSLYAGYLILKSEMDPKGLFSEIRVLFTRILDRLAGSQREKQLLELYRNKELVRKLLNLELTRKDWQEVLAKKDLLAMDPLVAGLKEIGTAVSRESGLPLTNFETKPVNPKFRKEVTEVQEAAYKFYEAARKREDVFYEKIDSVMRKESLSKAVLITGGFHTDGITELLREHEVSYGILTPRLSEKSDENLYRNVMLMNRSYPFEISNLEAISLLQPWLAAERQGMIPRDALKPILRGIMEAAGVELKVAVKIFNQQLQELAKTGENGGIERLEYAGFGKGTGKPTYRIIRRSEAQVQKPISGVVSGQPDLSGVLATRAEIRDALAKIAGSQMPGQPDPRVLDAAAKFNELGMSAEQRVETKEVGTTPELLTNAAVRAEIRRLAEETGKSLATTAASVAQVMGQPSGVRDMPVGIRSVIPSTSALPALPHISGNEVFRASPPFQRSEMRNYESSWKKWDGEFALFEAQRKRVEQQLKGLLRLPQFKIQVIRDFDPATIRKDSLRRMYSADIFEGWPEYIKLSSLSGEDFRGIALAFWDELLKPNVTVTIDDEEKVFSGWDAQGGFVRDSKYLFLNLAASSPQNLIAYHEFSEVMIKKYGVGLDLGSEPITEYTVDLVTLKMLAALKRFDLIEKYQHEVSMRTIEEYPGLSVEAKMAAEKNAQVIFDRAQGKGHRSEQREDQLAQSETDSNPVIDKAPILNDMNKLSTKTPAAGMASHTVQAQRSEARDEGQVSPGKPDEMEGARRADRIPEWFPGNPSDSIETRQNQLVEEVMQAGSVSAYVRSKGFAQGQIAQVNYYLRHHPEIRDRIVRSPSWMPGDVTMSLAQRHKLLIMDLLKAKSVLAYEEAAGLNKGTVSNYFNNHPEVKQEYDKLKFPDWFPGKPGEDPETRTRKFLTALAKAGSIPLLEKELGKTIHLIQSYLRNHPDLEQKAHDVLVPSWFPGKPGKQTSEERGAMLVREIARRGGPTAFAKVHDLKPTATIAYLRYHPELRRETNLLLNLVQGVPNRTNLEQFFSDPGLLEDWIKQFETTREAMKTSRNLMDVSLIRLSACQWVFEGPERARLALAYDRLLARRLWGEDNGLKTVDMRRQIQDLRERDAEAILERLDGVSTVSLQDLWTALEGQLRTAESVNDLRWLINFILAEKKAAFLWKDHGMTLAADTREPYTKSYDAEKQSEARWDWLTTKLHRWAEAVSGIIKVFDERFTTQRLGRDWEQRLEEIHREAQQLQGQGLLGTITIREVRNADEFLRNMESILTRYTPVEQHVNVQGYNSAKKKLEPLLENLSKFNKDTRLLEEIRPKRKATGDVNADVLARNLALDVSFQQSVAGYYAMHRQLQDVSAGSNYGTSVREALREYEIKRLREKTPEVLRSIQTALEKTTLESRVQKRLIEMDMSNVQSGEGKKRSESREDQPAQAEADSTPAGPATALLNADGGVIAKVGSWKNVTFGNYQKQILTVFGITPDETKFYRRTFGDTYEAEVGGRKVAIKMVGGVVGALDPEKSSANIKEEVAILQITQQIKGIPKFYGDIQTQDGKTVALVREWFPGDPLDIVATKMNQEELKDVADQVEVMIRDILNAKPELFFWDENPSNYVIREIGFENGKRAFEVGGIIDCVFTADKKRITREESDAAVRALKEAILALKAAGTAETVPDAEGADSARSESREGEQLPAQVKKFQEVGRAPSAFQRGEDRTSYLRVFADRANHPGAALTMLPLSPAELSSITGAFEPVLSDVQETNALKTALERFLKSENWNSFGQDSPVIANRKPQHCWDYARTIAVFLSFLEEEGLMKQWTFFGYASTPALGNHVVTVLQRRGASEDDRESLIVVDAWVRDFGEEILVEPYTEWRRHFLIHTLYRDKNLESLNRGISSHNVITIERTPDDGSAVSPVYDDVASLYYSNRPHEKISEKNLLFRSKASAISNSPPAISVESGQGTPAPIASEISSGLEPKKTQGRSEVRENYFKETAVQFPEMVKELKPLPPDIQRLLGLGLHDAEDSLARRVPKPGSTTTELELKLANIAKETVGLAQYPDKDFLARPAISDLSGRIRSAEFEQLSPDLSKKFVNHVRFYNLEHAPIVPFTYFNFGEDVYFRKRQITLNGESLNITHALVLSGSALAQVPVQANLTEFFLVNGVYVGCGVTRYEGPARAELQYNIFPEVPGTRFGRSQVEGLSKAIYGLRLEDLGQILDEGAVVTVPLHQFTADEIAANNAKTLGFYKSLEFEPSNSAVKLPTGKIIPEEFTEELKHKLNLGLKKVLSRSEVRDQGGAAAVFPKAVDLEVLKRAPEYAWYVNDRTTNEKWYLKLDTPSEMQKEKRGYQLAALAGVNIPRWTEISVEDLSMPEKFSRYWNAQIMGLRYDINSLNSVTAILSRDANDLTLPELADPRTSGIEKILAFLALTGATDFKLDHNVGISTIDGRRYYVLYDLTNAAGIQPIGTPFSFDGPLVLKALSEAGPEFLVQAVRDVASIDPQDLQRVLGGKPEDVLSLIRTRQQALGATVLQALKVVKEQNVDRLDAERSARINALINALAELNINAGSTVAPKAEEQQPPVTRSEMREVPGTKEYYRKRIDYLKGSQERIATGRDAEGREIPEILTFGDKHGKVGDLEAILSEAKEAARTGKPLHIMGHGDGFDRGGQNKRVWEIFQELVQLTQDHPNIKVDLFLGNHDVFMIESVLLKDPSTFTDWIINGACATLKEFGFPFRPGEVEAANQAAIKYRRAIQKYSQARKTGDERMLLESLKEMNEAEQKVGGYAADWLVRDLSSVQELALWMVRNFKLFAEDERGFLHVHAGIPMNKDGNPTIDREALERLGEEWSAIQKGLENDPRLEIKANQDHLTGYFLSAKDIFWAKKKDWIDQFFGSSVDGAEPRVNEAVLDNYLTRLGCAGIVGAHIHLKKLFRANNRVFIIDVDEGDPGHLAFNKGGIQFNGASGRIDPIATKEEVLAGMDAEIARLEELLEKAPDAGQVSPAIPRTEGPRSSPASPLDSEAFREMEAHWKELIRGSTPETMDEVYIQALTEMDQLSREPGRGEQFRKDFFFWLEEKVKRRELTYGKALGQAIRMLGEDPDPIAAFSALDAALLDDRGAHKEDFKATLAAMLRSAGKETTINVLAGLAGEENKKNDHWDRFNEDGSVDDLFSASRENMKFLQLVGDQRVSLEVRAKLIERYKRIRRSLLAEQAARPMIDRILRKHPELFSGRSEMRDEKAVFIYDVIPGLEKREEEIRRVWDEAWIAAGRQAKVETSAPRVRGVSAKLKRNASLVLLAASLNFSNPVFWARTAPVAAFVMTAGTACSQGARGLSVVAPSDIPVGYTAFRDLPAEAKKVLEEAWAEIAAMAPNSRDPVVRDLLADPNWQNHVFVSPNSTDRPGGGAGGRAYSQLIAVDQGALDWVLKDRNAAWEIFTGTLLHELIHMAHYQQGLAGSRSFLAEENVTRVETAEFFKTRYYVFDPPKYDPAKAASVPLAVTRYDPNSDGYKTPPVPDSVVVFSISSSGLINAYPGQLSQAVINWAVQNSRSEIRDEDKVRLRIIIPKSELARIKRTLVIGTLSLVLLIGGAVYYVFHNALLPGKPSTVSTALVAPVRALTPFDLEALQGDLTAIDTENIQDERMQRIVRHYLDTMVFLRDSERTLYPGISEKERAERIQHLAFAAIYLTYLENPTFEPYQKKKGPAAGPFQIEAQSAVDVFREAMMAPEGSPVRQLIEKNWTPGVDAFYKALKSPTYNTLDLDNIRKKKRGRPETARVRESIASDPTLQHLLWRLFILIRMEPSAQDVAGRPGEKDGWPRFHRKYNTPYLGDTAKPRNEGEEADLHYGLATYLKAVAVKAFAAELVERTMGEALSDSYRKQTAALFKNLTVDLYQVEHVNVPLTNSLRRIRDAESLAEAIRGEMDKPAKERNLKKLQQYRNRISINLRNLAKLETGYLGEAGRMLKKLEGYSNKGYTAAEWEMIKNEAAKAVRDAKDTVERLTPELNQYARQLDPILKTPPKTVKPSPQKAKAGKAATPKGKGRSEMRQEEVQIFSRRNLLLGALGLSLGIGVAQKATVDHWSSEGTREFDPKKYEFRIVERKDIKQLLAEGWTYVSNANPFREISRRAIGWFRLSEDAQDRAFIENGSAMLKGIFLLNRNGDVLIRPAEGFRPENYPKEQWAQGFQAGPMAITEGNLNPNIENWHKSIFSGRKSVVGVDPSGRVHTLDIFGWDIFGWTGPTTAKLIEALENWHTTYDIKEALFVDGGDTGDRFTQQTPATALMAFPRSEMRTEKITQEKIDEINEQLRGLEVAMREGGAVDVYSSPPTSHKAAVADLLNLQVAVEGGLKITHRNSETGEIETVTIPASTRLTPETAEKLGIRVEPDAFKSSDGWGTQDDGKEQRLKYLRAHPSVTDLQNFRFYMSDFDKIGAKNLALGGKGIVGVMSLERSGEHLITPKDSPVLDYRKTILVIAKKYGLEVYRGVGGDEIIFVPARKVTQEDLENFLRDLNEEFFGRYAVLEVEKTLTENEAKIFESKEYASVLSAVLYAGSTYIRVDRRKLDAEGKWQDFLRDLHTKLNLEGDQLHEIRFEKIQSENATPQKWGFLTISIGAAPAAGNPEFPEQSGVLDYFKEVMKDVKHEDGGNYWTYIKDDVETLRPERIELFDECAMWLANDALSEAKKKRNQVKVGIFVKKEVTRDKIEEVSKKLAERASSSEKRDPKIIDTLTGLLTEGAGQEAARKVDIKETRHLIVLGYKGQAIPRAFHEYQNMDGVGYKGGDQAITAVSGSARELFGVKDEETVPEMLERGEIIFRVAPDEIVEVFHGDVQRNRGPPTTIETFDKAGLKLEEELKKIPGTPETTSPILLLIIAQQADLERLNGLASQLTPLQKIDNVMKMAAWLSDVVKAVSPEDLEKAMDVDEGKYGKIARFNPAKAPALLFLFYKAQREKARQSLDELGGRRVPYSELIAEKPVSRSEMRKGVLTKVGTEVVTIETHDGVLDYLRERFRERKQRGEANPALPILVNFDAHPDVGTWTQQYLVPINEGNWGSRALREGLITYFVHVPPSEKILGPVAIRIWTMQKIGWWFRPVIVELKGKELDQLAGKIFGTETFVTVCADAYSLQESPPEWITVNMRKELGTAGYHTDPNNFGKQSTPLLDFLNRYGLQPDPKVYLTKSPDWVGPQVDEAYLESLAGHLKEAIPSARSETREDILGYLTVSVKKRQILSNEKANEIASWLLSPSAGEPLRLDLVQQTLDYIFRIRAFTKKPCDELLKLLSQKLRESMEIEEKQTGSLFEWMMENQVVPRNVPAEVFEDFFRTYLSQYRIDQNPQGRFFYNLPPGLDSKTKLVLATQNMKKMEQMFAPEFRRRQSVQIARISGTPYLIEMRYGFGKGSSGVLIAIGEAIGERTQWIYRIGVDTQQAENGEALRVAVITGGLNQKEQIRETFPQRIGLHPGLALLCVALGLAQQKGFAVLSGIKGKYIPIQKYVLEANPGAIYDRFKMNGGRGENEYARWRTVSDLLAIWESEPPKVKESWAEGARKMFATFRDLEEVSIDKLNDFVEREFTDQMPGGAPGTEKRSEVREAEAAKIEKTRVAAELKAVGKRLETESPGAEPGTQRSEMRVVREAISPADMLVVEQAKIGPNVEAVNNLEVQGAKGPVIVAAVAGMVFDDGLKAEQMADVIVQLANASAAKTAGWVTAIRDVFTGLAGALFGKTTQIEIMDKQGLEIELVPADAIIEPADLGTLVNKMQGKVMVLMADGAAEVAAAEQRKRGMEQRLAKTLKELNAEKRFDIIVVDKNNPETALNNFITSKMKTMPAISRGPLGYVFMGSDQFLKVFKTDTGRGLMIKEPYSTDVSRRVATSTLASIVSQRILSASEVDAIKEVLNGEKDENGFRSFSQDALSKMLVIAMQALQAIQSAA
ncbi:MAG: hypothetical protein ABH891_00465 [Candidatus Omnitrophota bacterium]